MKLSTKGRYAVMAMVDLAQHSADVSLSLQDISERQSLSLAYLEQLFAKLRRADLVISKRGAQGGYQLAKLPRDISILHIMNAVEEPLHATRCIPEEDQGCHGLSGKCVTHKLWQGLSLTVIDYLASQSLDSIVQQGCGK